MRTRLIPMTLTTTNMSLPQSTHRNEKWERAVFNFEESFGSKIFWSFIQFLLMSCSVLFIVLFSKSCPFGY